MPKGLVLTIAKNAKRLDTFLAANARSGLELVPHMGIDTRMFTREELVAHGLIRPDLAPAWIPGYLAHALSTRQIWQEAARACEPTWVFEDDAYLADDLPAKVAAATAHLPGWDFLMLGFNTDSFLDVRWSPEMSQRSVFSLLNPTVEQIRRVLDFPQPRVFPLNQVFGMTGYVITPQGARTCLEACFPLRNATLQVPALNKVLGLYTLDGLLNLVYPRIRAYVFVPPLVLATNHPATSSMPDRPGDPLPAR